MPLNMLVHYLPYCCLTCLSGNQDWNLAPIELRRSSEDFSERGAGHEASRAVPAHCSQCHGPPSVFNNIRRLRKSKPPVKALEASSRHLFHRVINTIYVCLHGKTKPCVPIGGQTFVCQPIWFPCFLPEIWIRYRLQHLGAYQIQIVERLVIFSISVLKCLKVFCCLVPCCPEMPDESNWACIVRRAEWTVFHPRRTIIAFHPIKSLTNPSNLL